MINSPVNLSVVLRAHVDAAYRSRQDPIAEVITYVLDGAGKLVRPQLVYLCAKSCHSYADEAQLVSAATAPMLAIEMVHAYSLVHDDLPCMDDDDLRRGRPTVHRKFDEVRALLAGDALLTDAFDVLSRAQDLDSEQKLSCVQELARAAGSNGMVLGQTLDVLNTGRKNFSQELIDCIHLRKTGDLLGAACAMGAIVGGAAKIEVAKFREFGQQVGLCFQIIDDLIDEHDATGKSRGKDLAQGKATYTALMTREEGLARARVMTADSKNLLLGAGALQCDELFSFVDQLLQRKL